MDKICIYHGYCADGFTAAWVVKKALGDIDFHGGVHQMPPPNVKGKDVIIVDFSYKKPVMENIIKDANSVIVLDHHKTAQKELEVFKNTKNVEIVFDMKRSGAGITWDYFFPTVPRPDFVNYVEDRDLWKKQLPHCEDVNSFIFSYEYTFENWDMIEKMINKDFRDMILEGSAITRKHMKDIRELLKVCTRKFKIGGVIVPVANLHYTMSSEAAQILAENEPFAGCYYDSSEGRIFSLRSKEYGMDVSAIAKEYGGGGHEHASGFKVDFDHPLATNNKEFCDL